MRSLAFVFLSLSLSATAAERVPLQIPFRWTPGQIEIQVSIQGRPPIWCILDSGAEFTMLDGEVGKALKLGPIHRRNGRERIENLTLQIGPVALEGMSVTLWALDNFRRQKRDIRGVVGCELFERYVVTVDYQKHVLILSEPSSFRPSPAAVPLPIAFDGRLPVLDTSLTIHGKRIPAKLMVDTGASQAVILRHPFATKHRLFATSDPTTTSETVATGGRTFITLSVQALALGRWSFKNPAVKAYGSPAGAGGYATTDGLLGNDVLRHFRVTFDYSRKRLIFEDARNDR